VLLKPKGEKVKRFEVQEARFFSFCVGRGEERSGAVVKKGESGISMGQEGKKKDASLRRREDSISNHEEERMRRGTAEAKRKEKKDLSILVGK